MRCCVGSCTNDTKNSQRNQSTTFHKFPREITLKNAWLRALNMVNFEPADHSVVCSDHFDDEDFYLTQGGLKKIKLGALPVVIGERKEHLESPAIIRVCRICLAIDLKMYHIQEFNLEKDYQDLTGSIIIHQDLMPQNLCWECTRRLRNAVKFKRKALTSQRILMDILNEDGCIKLTNVKAVDRHNCNLQSSLVCQYYEPNDYDTQVNEYEVKVKSAREADDYKASLLNGNMNKDLDMEELIRDVRTRRSKKLLDKKSEYSTTVSNATGENCFKETLFDAEVKVEEFPLLDAVPLDRGYVISDNDIVERTSYCDDEGVDEDPDFSPEDDEPISRIKDENFPNTNKTRISELEKFHNVENMFLESEKKAKRDFLHVKRKILSDKRNKKNKEKILKKITKRKNEPQIKKKRPSQLDASIFIIRALTLEEQMLEVDRRKESDSYRNAPFKCNFCFRGYLNKNKYDTHMVRHSEKCGLYECVVCKSRVKTDTALKKHLKAMHSVEYNCTKCAFVTRNSGVAFSHKRWHEGTKYQCPHCSKQFEKKTTYFGHLRYKHLSDLACNMCGYVFINKYGLSCHKKRKHPDADAAVVLSGPYCAECDVTFANEEAHSRHLQLSLRHVSETDPNRISNDPQTVNPVKCSTQGKESQRAPENSWRPVNCEQCGLLMRNFKVYANHFRQEHPDQNRTLFSTASAPFLCELCGKMFASKHALSEHSRGHRGAGAECDVCGKTFGKRSYLARHRARHSAAAPRYPCPVCGAHFTQNHNRKRHMITHTGHKPYRCDACGKCFTTKKSQSDHTAHVHNNKPRPHRRRPARAQNAGDKCISGDSD